MSVFASYASWLFCLALFGYVSFERARIYGLTSRFSMLPVCVSVTISGVALTVLVCKGTTDLRAPVLLACAAVSAVTDVLTGYVFDRMLTAAACGLLLAAAMSRTLTEALFGAAVGGVLVAIPFLCSRMRAMGFGDVKLAAVLGLGLSASAAAYGVWLAFVSGGLLACALLLTRRSFRGSEIALGPFLAGGFCTVMLLR